MQSLQKKHDNLVLIFLLHELQIDMYAYKAIVNIL